MSVEAATKQIANEFTAIENMLEVAAEYKLETEVVWQLCHTLQLASSDMSIQEAAYLALCEWDL